MRTTFRPLCLALLLATTCTAFGAGGGEMPSRPMAGSSSPPPSPQEQARSAYNAGVKAVEKADELSADATHQPDARHQAKALDKAKDSYASALE